MTIAKISAPMTYHKCISEVNNYNISNTLLLNTKPAQENLFPVRQYLIQSAMKRFTFDELPEAVSQLFDRLDRIENRLQQEKEESSKEKDLLTISGAAKFLKLSVATLYSKVCRREVPVNKQGKRLYFYRSELSQWIRSGRRKTNDELDKEIDSRRSK